MMTAPAYLSAPCSNCPFLKMGGVRVRTARMNLILRGSTFSCHKTVDYDAREENGDDDSDDEDNRLSAPGKDEAVCGGFLIFNDKQQTDTQMMRIAQRLGMYNPADSKQRDKVFDTRSELMASCLDAEELEEIEPCGIVNRDCEAPAGFVTDNGGVEEGTVGAEFMCDSCDRPVCGACSVEKEVEQPKKGRKKAKVVTVRICDDCAEET